VIECFYEVFKDLIEAFLMFLDLIKTLYKPVKWRFEDGTKESEGYED
jgi:hypothetical protein